MKVIASALALCSLLVACVFNTDEAAHRAEYAEAGQEAIQLLRSNQFQAVANRMHYPPTYTPKELEKDRTDVSRALAFLASEFGRFESAERATGVFTFYNLEVRSGEANYWEKQQNNGQDGFLRYRVNYERLGPGFLKVSFYDRNDVFELRSVSFELDASQPGAKYRIVEVGRRMMATLQSHGSEMIK